MKKIPKKAKKVLSDAGGPIITRDSKEDSDAELETAWERSRVGIRANPKRFIPGLVYSEEDKKENQGKQPPPAKRTARLREASSGD